jgi:2-polyprenyl-3-methyl-5-hydroxy-6-metoxy-1,4-benzoquinol methylase
MEDVLYDIFYEVEKKHWWFKARLHILLYFLKDRIKLKKENRLLDVGCGTGAVLESLQKEYDAFGIDMSDKAIEFCKLQGISRVTVSSLDQVPSSDKFDILTFFDVIEHIEKDEEVLQNAYNLLVAGGNILITVPAYKFMWSSHDDLNLHYRRYTKKQLKEKVEAAGFKVEHITYYNTFLFPLALIQRLFSNLQKNPDHADLSVPNSFLNNLLYKIFVSEKKIISKASFPFGVSILCWGVKKP